jgi:aminoglycoside phosphotransferase (APT) family kinase protein
MSDETKLAASRDAAAIAALLEALRSDLERVVRPAIVDPNALASARMITDILDYLIVWCRDVSGVVEDLDTRLQSIVREEASYAGVGDMLPSHGRRNGLLQSLEASIERGGLDRSRIGEAVAADLALFEEENRLRAALQRREQAEHAGIEVEVTAARLQALVEPLCGGRTGKVVSFHRVYGGYSKDTFLFDLVVDQGATESLVLRRDLPFGPAGTTVTDEFTLLRRLFERGFPVAQPLLIDSEGRHVGQPAMVSHRVPGRPGTEDWSADPVRRDGIVTRLAHIVARLHAQAPADLGFPAGPADATAAVRAYLEHWRDRWHRHRVHPSATIAAGFDWLLAHVPAIDGGAVVVHGDIGFHNVMVEGGEITALLDWEFAHVGDPVEDLGYARQFIEPLGCWELFLETYRAAGGAPYRPGNARFYEVWRSVRNAVCCMTSWSGFLDGSYPALKMAYQGIVFYRHFARDAALQLRKELT